MSHSVSTITINIEHSTYKIRMHTAYSHTTYYFFVLIDFDIRFLRYASSLSLPNLKWLEKCSFKGEFRSEIQIPLGKLVFIVWLNRLVVHNLWVTEKKQPKIIKLSWKNWKLDEGIIVNKFITFASWNVDECVSWLNIFDEKQAKEWEIKNYDSKNGIQRYNWTDKSH